MISENDIYPTTVFRCADFGLGMFDDHDLRTEIIDGEVWLMCGNRQVEMGYENDGLEPDDAESIGHLLIKSAQYARKTDTHSQRKPLSSL